MKNKIVLIGFAACYKSSAGKIIAKRLGYKLADTDKLAQDKAGMPVSRILNELGEQAFRQIEGETLIAVSQMENVVISCGGGSVLSQDFATLAKDSEVVWLTATAQTIYKRLNGKTRPLFDSLTVDELQAKMDERHSLYERYSTLRFTTDNRSSRQVAEEVLSVLNKA